MKLDTFGRAIPDSPAERTALLAYSQKIAFAVQGHARNNPQITREQIGAIVEEWLMAVPPTVALFGAQPTTPRAITTEFDYPRKSEVIG